MRSAAANGDAIIPLVCCRVDNADANGLVFVDGPPPKSRSEGGILRRFLRDAKQRRGEKISSSSHSLTTQSHIHTSLCYWGEGGGGGMGDGPLFHLIKDKASKKGMFPPAKTKINREHRLNSWTIHDSLWDVNGVLGQSRINSCYDLS